MLKCFNVKMRNGFSILETVVSLGIITIGIIGVLGLFTQTIRSGEISFNQEIAINLAQEGIEVIRNQRDSNWIIPNIDWNDGINGTEYKVNFKNDNTWEIIEATGFQKLYLRSEKIYTHETGNNTQTIFERKIEIKNNTDMLEITSTVQWTERGNTQSIIMKDNLYNWQ